MTQKQSQKVFDRIDDLVDLGKYTDPLYRDHSYVREDGEVIRVFYHETKFYVDTYESRYKIDSKIDKENAEVYKETEGDEIVEVVESFLDS